MIRLVARLPALAFLLCAHALAEPLPSGTDFLSGELRARQADAAMNPGMLWVAEGADLWATPTGAAGKSCGDCHGDAEQSMAGVATRYPSVDAATGDLLNLEARINRCRTRHQGTEPLGYETDELLSLTAFVSHQSLGMPVAVQTGGRAQPFLDRGRDLFHLRQGQMNLACANCHVENAGRRLRGDVISHGLGNGYPAYRLEWQGLGSLHRRLRACALGVRAVQFAPGSPEFLALELYIAARARGVPVETPAIRR